MKNVIITTVLVACFTLLSTASFSQVVVKVKPAEPTLTVYQPAKPGPNYVWIDGHWHWSKKKDKYIWVDAQWIKKKKNKTYVKGHWKKTAFGWKWVPGHWA